MRIRKLFIPILRNTNAMISSEILAVAKTALSMKSLIRWAPKIIKPCTKRSWTEELEYRQEQRTHAWLLGLCQFPFEYQSKDKIKFYIACAILITIRFKMSLVGNFSTCSVCGKLRIIAKQLSKVLSKQNREDVYLECKECAAIPIWDTNTKDGNQKTFDHYQ